MKNVLEIMEQVIREKNAQKFISQEAKHLTKENKDKLIAVLVKYEKFLRIEDER